MNNETYQAQKKESGLALTVLQTSSSSSKIRNYMFNPKFNPYAILYRTISSRRQIQSSVFDSCRKYKFKNFEEFVMQVRERNLPIYYLSLIHLLFKSVNKHTSLQQRRSAPHATQKPHATKFTPFFNDWIRYC